MGSGSERGGMLLMGMIVAILLLAGCAPQKVRLPVPAPRPESAVRPEPAPPSEPAAQPEPAVRPEPVPRPEPLPRSQPAVSPAAAPLLAAARQSLAKKDLPGAEAYLERAIRLEGGNGLLWHTLAETKYRQGDYPQAVQLALRANALLRAADPLVRENYRLMERAHRKLGQVEQARQAAARAEALK